MITYNHGLYIRQAVESIVQQKTTFPFRVFLYEDCSTDATAQICSALKTEYPELIELHLAEKNIGAKANLKLVHDRIFNSEAKYIAVCEGDDYWTDQRKLQKQYDVLERDTQTTVVFHDVALQYGANTVPHNNVPERGIGGETNTYTRADLARDNFIPTVSVMWRRLPHYQLPPWFYESVIVDYPTHFLHAGEGRIARIPEVMAVYRKHASGVWTGARQEESLSRILEVLDNMNSEWPNYSSQFTYFKATLILNLALWFFHRGEQEKFKSYAAQADAMLPQLTPSDLVEVNRLLISGFSSGGKMALFLKASRTIQKLRDFLK